MDALNVISLDQAKNWLIVEDSADDADITRLIKTAVAWVENYTCYRFYQREEILYTQQTCFNNDYFPVSNQYQIPRGIVVTPSGLSVYVFPFSITSLIDTNNEPVINYRIGRQPLKSLIFAPANCKVVLQTGYATPTDAPAPLLEACYKLITYLYENRDMYENQLPTDVQMLLNQYRRAII